MTITDTRTVYVEPMVWARRDTYAARHETHEYHTSRWCYRLANPYVTLAVTRQIAIDAGWHGCAACERKETA